MLEGLNSVAEISVLVNMCRELLLKISTTLQFPNSPKLSKISLPLSITSAQKKIERVQSRERYD